MAGMQLPRGFRGLRYFPLDGSIPPVFESLNFETVYAYGGDTVIATIDRNGGPEETESVSWGGTPCTITAQDATTVTFTTPVKAAGSYDLVIDGSNAISMESWSPAILNLTTLLRAPFTAAPWVGNPSAGSSGTADATTLGVDPVPGTPINGIAPAAFDATNDSLSLGTMGSKFGPNGNFAGVIIAKYNSGNKSIFQTASSYLDCSLLSAGPAMRILMMNNDAATKVATTPASISTLYFIHFKCDLSLTGAELNIGLNGAWGVTPTATTSGLHSNGGIQANAFSLGAVADADVLEAATMSGGVISDADLTKWRTCASCRYGVSL